MSQLTEDPDERRMFDHHAKLAGGPLGAIALALTVWSRAAPPQGSYGKALAIYANECLKASETPPVRQALNMAARVVEDEALLFYEEAAEIVPAVGENHNNKEAWERYNITKGRALSLRKLANTIRSLRP